jgi:anti-anti-sigma regulatory factor
LKRKGGRMAALGSGKVKVMVLRLDRDIDIKDMERICEIVERYRSRGYTFSIIDLGAVNHVNFLSLKRLAKTAGDQRAAGGFLSLSGMSGYLKNMFQVVGVYNDFQYFPSSSSGIHAIQKERQVNNLDIAVIQGKNLQTIH